MYFKTYNELRLKEVVGLGDEAMFVWSGKITGLDLEYRTNFP